MDALLTKTAGELALQGSGWACAVILGGWSFYLFRLLRGADKENRELLKQVITLAESGKAGLAAAAKAADETGALVGTLTSGIQALSREVEGDERETRHGIASMLAGQQGIAQRLEKLSDQLFARERP